MTSREQWLQERMRGLGGSDAAAALGLSKWKTPYALYLEKRGESAPIEETEPMLWGKLLEPVVIQRYSDVTQRAVRTFRNELHWSKRHKFMFVSPDALALHEKRAIEAKTARTREGWGEPGTDQIPQEYVVQAQHLLIVEELPVCDVPVLFGGQEFAVYEVAADRELQDMVQDGEADFWRRVERGEPPDPINLDDVNLRYGRRSIANAVQANTDVLNACALLRALKTQGESVKAQCEKLEVLIKSHLGESETLVYGREVLATWKASKPRESFDRDGFKSMHPDLHAQFITTGEPTRRFILKGLS